MNLKVTLTKKCKMSKVKIIAEAGVNHNGSFSNIIQMINIASEAGADFIKFQTFKAKNLVSSFALKAEYQKKNTSEKKDQYSMLKKLEIPEKWYSKIISHCHDKGIGFLSSVFDKESVDFLIKYGLTTFKIPSGEITNKPLLKYVAQKAKKIILSTGMSNISEIKKALDVIYFQKFKSENITLLHCNTEYPTKNSEVNLLAINHIKDEFKVPIGFSDHTLGNEAAVASVALGSQIIEKHFTLNKDLPGPDHKASMSPRELRGFIISVRKVTECISGDGIKKPTPSELKNKEVVRKSLFYKKKLLKGHTLCEGDFISLRPEIGICPMEIDSLNNRILRVDVNKNQVTKFSDLK